MNVLNVVRKHLKLYSDPPCVAGIINRILKQEQAMRKCLSSFDVELRVFPYVDDQSNPYS
jgi:hypothetical protein